MNGDNSAEHFQGFHPQDCFISVSMLTHALFAVCLLAAGKCALTGWTTFIPTHTSHHFSWIVFVLIVVVWNFLGPLNVKLKIIM